MAKCGLRDTQSHNEHGFSQQALPELPEGTIRCAGPRGEKEEEILLAFKELRVQEVERHISKEVK